MVCFLASSARADSFTFTGDATFGNDIVDFSISGPSTRLHSAAPTGPTGVQLCDQGTTCIVYAQFVPTTLSNISAPGDFSGGTVGGVTAYSLMGGLIQQQPGTMLPLADNRGDRPCQENTLRPD